MVSSHVVGIERKGFAIKLIEMMSALFATPNESWLDSLFFESLYGIKENQYADEIKK